MSDRDVVVCGSRGWGRPDLVGARLARLPAGTVVWHGANPRGADLHAAMHLVALRDRGIEQRPVEAEWARHGRRQAGPIRNRRLLDEARPRLVLAFWDGSSPGTADMIDEARRRGIEVEVTRRDGAVDPRQLPLSASFLD